MTTHDNAESQDVLYKLMLQLDKFEDLDNHPLRKTQAYKDACHTLGWDIDWEKLADERR